MLEKIKYYFDIRKELEDFEYVHTEIEKSIVFKGTNLWILVWNKFRNVLHLLCFRKSTMKSNFISGWKSAFWVCGVFLTQIIHIQILTKNNFY
jgi:hypothetical protein